MDTADFATTAPVLSPCRCTSTNRRPHDLHLNHCGAKVVFVVGVPQLQKLLAVRANLPELEQIVVADGGSDVPSECLRYETLSPRKRGGRLFLPYARFASSSGQLASLIYTSGTTGEPRRHAHAHEFLLQRHRRRQDFQLNPAEDVAISFLPLAHVYGRTMDYIYVFQGARWPTSSLSMPSPRLFSKSTNDYRRGTPVF